MWPRKRDVVELTTEPLKWPLNYRTGSGSDLAVWIPLNQKVVNAVALLARLKINLRKTQVEFVATARSLPLPVL